MQHQLEKASQDTSTKTEDATARGNWSLNQPTITRHVGVQLAEFCLLRVFSIDVPTPRVSVECPPFSHIASSEEVREVKRQGFQNLLHGDRTFERIGHLRFFGRRITGRHHGERQKTWMRRIATFPLWRYLLHGPLCLLRLGPSAVGACGRSSLPPPKDVSIVLRRCGGLRGCHAGDWSPRDA